MSSCFLAKALCATQPAGIKLPLLAQIPVLTVRIQVALSVVIDSPQDWEQARSKMPDLAKATILFDSGARASKQYGLLSAHSSMHAGSMPGHTYIVIDKQGIVRDVYDDANMAVNNDILSKKIADLNK